MRIISNARIREIRQIPIEIKGATEIADFVYLSLNAHPPLLGQAVNHHPEFLRSVPSHYVQPTLVIHKKWPMLHAEFFESDGKEEEKSFDTDSSLSRFPHFKFLCHELPHGLVVAVHKTL